MVVAGRADGQTDKRAHYETLHFVSRIGRYSGTGAMMNQPGVVVGIRMMCNFAHG